MHCIYNIKLYMVIFVYIEHEWYNIVHYSIVNLYCILL
jgi:hypothetical protein